MKIARSLYRMSYTGILILSSKYLKKDEFYEKIIRDKIFRI